MEDKYGGIMREMESLIDQFRAQIISKDKDPTENTSTIKGKADNFMQTVHYTPASTVLRNVEGNKTDVPNFWGRSCIIVLFPDPTVHAGDVGADSWFCKCSTIM